MPGNETEEKSEEITKARMKRFIDIQQKLVYKIFDYPPKTQKDGDRDFVWNLLCAGCPPYYILEAFERMCRNYHPDDAYEPDEPYIHENGGL